MCSCVGLLIVDSSHAGDDRKEPSRVRRSGAAAVLSGEADERSGGSDQRPCGRGRRGQRRQQRAPGELQCTEWP